MTKLTLPTRASLVLAAALLLPGPSAIGAEPGMEELSRFLDFVQRYYALLDSVHTVAESPQRTSIMHLQKMKEIHEDRGDSAAAADALREVIADSSDQTVRNAARMMLVDVLRDTGRASEALRVIDEGLAENAGGR